MDDSDAIEAQEWLDALAAVKEHLRVDRATFISSASRIDKYGA